MKLRQQHETRTYKSVFTDNSLHLVTHRAHESDLPPEKHSGPPSPMKTLLFLAAPFDYYSGGSEYQYMVLEKALKPLYNIYYLFRHPNRNITDRRYITYDYFVRNAYSEYVYTDAPKIYRLIDKLSPDIIYKRGVNYISFIGTYFAKTRNRKMVLHIASTSDVERPRLRLNKYAPFKIVNYCMAKYTLQHAHRVICQTKYQAETLLKHTGRNSDLVVPNFHPAPAEECNKQNPIKVVWIANLKQWKQPELFVQLAKEFTHYQKVRFIMVGRREYTSYHQQICEAIDRLPNVDYKGELPIDDVNKILAGAHIFVNTSLPREGFPNTFIQAWMRKVPVVSLNVDPDDIIKTYGIGFHSRTFQGMKEHVKLLIDNENLRELMGDKSQQFALNTYSLSNIEKVNALLDNGQMTS